MGVKGHQRQVIEGDIDGMSNTIKEDPSGQKVF